MSNDLLHEIERLNKVVEDLQAENERLRKCLQSEATMTNEMQAKYVEQVHENERLRAALKEVHDNAVGHWVMQKEQLSMIDSIACQALEVTK